MGVYHGHDSYLTYGKESSFGVKASSPTKWIGIVQSFSPEETNNIQKQYGLGSRNFQQARVGARTVSGSFEYLVQDLKMLEFALGSVSTTDNGDGTYTHTFTEANDLPSMTLQAGVLGSPNFVRDYVGCKVDKLAITAEKEEALVAEVDYLAKFVEDGTTGTAPVADTSSYFMFYEGTVTVNGVQQAHVEEFELEITNGLTALFAVNGENRPAVIQEGNREYALSMSFMFANSAQYDLWKNGTEFDVELKFVGQNGRELVITCNNCKYDSNELELGSDDYLVQELEAVVQSVTATYKTTEATL